MAIEYIYIYINLSLSLYIYKFTSIIVYKHGNAEKPTNQWRNASKRNWAFQTIQMLRTVRHEACAVFRHSPCGWWFFTGRPGYLLPFFFKRNTPTHELRDVGFCHPQIIWLWLSHIQPLFHCFNWTSLSPWALTTYSSFIARIQGQSNLSWFVLNKLPARRGLLCPLVSFLCQRRWTKIDRKTNWKIFRSFFRCPQFYSSNPQNSVLVLKSISSASNVLNQS